MGCYRIRGASSGHGGSSCTGVDAEETEWEMRPCGMVVQKRVLVAPAAECTASTTSASATTMGSRWKKKSKQRQQQRRQEMIRVRVVYGDSCYDVAVHYQATFGELKKLVSVDTGLRPPDQRLAFKGKDRRDGDYLDLCSVKDGSKVVLQEDPCSKERRYAQMEKAAREQAIQRAVGDVAMEVDRLADQVAIIHNSVSRGAKVAEAQITTLIEMLMRQAVSLDAIPAEQYRQIQGQGDQHNTSSLASHKHIQAKRIQKCVQELDVLLLSNATISSSSNNTHHQLHHTFDIATLNPRPMTTTPTTTTHWEFFD